MGFYILNVFSTCGSVWSSGKMTRFSFLWGNSSVVRWCLLPGRAGNQQPWHSSFPAPPLSPWERFIVLKAPPRFHLLVDPPLDPSSWKKLWFLLLAPLIYSEIWVGIIYINILHNVQHGVLVSSGLSVSPSISRISQIGFILCWDMEG